MGRSYSATPLWIVGGALSAGLLAFSQTGAGIWDEGFHLLAAQLINAGKTPYLDFFYQHPPLYAYVTAGWMRLFGDGWRSAHALSSLFSSGSIMLMAGYFFSRLPEGGWRAATAVTAALLIGLHLDVVRFGTIAYAYGLCLFLLACSFRLVVESVARSKILLPWAGGLCAGGAVASSLLSVPAVPILLLWMLWYDGSGERWKKGFSFVGGVTIALFPLVWLFVRGPRQTFFNVVEFHLFHRWSLSSAMWHDLKVVTAWLGSTQGLLLALLTAVGLSYVGDGPEWAERQRAEFYLCAWLTAGLGLYVAIAHPTFPRYFVVLVPFVSILASLGVYAMGTRIFASRRPGWIVLAVTGLFAVGLAKSAYQERSDLQARWRHYEDIAREVNRVTPAGALVYGDESLYVVARRLPPSGLENQVSRHLRVTPELAATLHVVAPTEIEAWLAAGRFETATICFPDEAWVQRLGLPGLYAKRTKVHHCDVFGGKVAP